MTLLEEEFDDVSLELLVVGLRRRRLDVREEEEDVVIEVDVTFVLRRRDRDVDGEDIVDDDVGFVDVGIFTVGSI